MLVLYFMAYFGYFFVEDMFVVHAYAYSVSGRSWGSHWYAYCLVKYLLEAGEVCILYIKFTYSNNVLEVEGNV